MESRPVNSLAGPPQDARAQPLAWEPGLVTWRPATPHLRGAIRSFDPDGATPAHIVVRTVPSARQRWHDGLADLESAISRPYLSTSPTRRLGTSDKALSVGGRICQR